MTGTDVEHHKVEGPTATRPRHATTAFAFRCSVSLPSLPPPPRRSAPATTPHARHLGLVTTRAQPQVARCPCTGSTSRVNAWLARPGTPDLRKLARSLPATRRLPLHKVTRGKPVQGRWMGENRRPSHRGRRAPGKRSRHWRGSPGAHDAPTHPVHQSLDQWASCSVASPM